MLTLNQVSWLPYTLISLVKVFGITVSPTVSSIPLLCAKSSICWNPIIYVLLNKQVKHQEMIDQVRKGYVTICQDMLGLVRLGRVCYNMLGYVRLGQVIWCAISNSKMKKSQKLNILNSYFDFFMLDFFELYYIKLKIFNRLGQAR